MTRHEKLIHKVNEFNACGEHIKQLWEEYNNSIGLRKDQLRYEISYELHMQQYRLNIINELKSAEEHHNDR